MIKIRTLRRVGGSIMIALPRSILQHLGGAVGDRIAMYPVDGGILLTRYDRRTERALEDLERFTHRHAQGMRRLVTPERGPP
jgi:antitoxin component of MazEF toxin-antitoxin module